MSLFFFITACIAGLVILASSIGHYKYNDTFHPLIFTFPIAGFLYVYSPLALHIKGELLPYLNSTELIYVQFLNVLCLSALFIGCMLGSKGVRRHPAKRDVHYYQMTLTWQRRLYAMSLLLGGVGFALYAYGLINVGGFVDAYSRAKGGGAAASGYLRDFTILTLPATLLLYMSRYRSGWRYTDTLLIVLFSAPYLVHGLLSARRGPTFLGIAILAGGWYLTRYRRPSFRTLATGGALVGVLLLVLVTYRGQIYLGSDFLSESEGITAMVERSLEKRSEGAYGNEFIYGSTAVLLARDSGEFYWGKRYLTYLFIRPIPSFIWENKYEDVGMEVLKSNAGVIRFDLNPQATESIPLGAAPGFITDFFVEFYWGAVLASMLIGIGFSTLWRYNIVYGGLWTVIYGVLLGLSLYFMTQTFGAFMFRFLEVAIVVYIVWKYYRRRHYRSEQKRRNIALRKRTIS